MMCMVLAGCIVVVLPQALHLTRIQKPCVNLPELMLPSDDEEVVNDINKWAAKTHEAIKCCGNQLHGGVL